ncbi:hypothetical protein YTPLAS18_03580 [Nitrospira sp.]|nr:hypothetical protein YTPLAS18_03580 [Nitrospira sp.]
MHMIRVLLANYPVMVPDAVRRLLQKQEDMELVGDCRGPLKILQETGRTNADAVILSQEGTEDLGICTHLLGVYPDLVIMSVTPNLTTAFTLQISIERRESVNTNLEDIPQLLRTAIVRGRNSLGEG